MLFVLIMHEVYIAESLLETAICKCRESGFNCIKSIKVKIGKASTVSSEALIFAFDILKSGGMADGASLIIEDVPTVGLCKTCESEFFVDKDFAFQCPYCGGESIMVKYGNGVELEEVEVDND